MPITVQRTDDTEHVTQISWGDWTLAGRSGSADAELIVGGYHDGEVATIRLDPGESVTGNLTGSAQVTGYAIFDATACRAPSR